MTCQLGDAMQAAQRALALREQQADPTGVGRNLHDQLRLALRWRALQSLPPSSVTAGMFTVSLNASPPDLQLDFVTPRAGAPDVTGLQLMEPSGG